MSCIQVTSYDLYMFFFYHNTDKSPSKLGYRVFALFPYTSVTSIQVTYDLNTGHA